MIKKSITSIVNLETGEKETRDYYFNLTKGEALELELMEQLESVGKSNDPKAIVPVFKRIINYAYGVKLPDGSWDKDPSRTRGFLASDAYSELFIGLLQEGEQGVIDFINATLSFPVNELGQPITGAEAPKRPAPQDYQKSAREIAAEAAAKKEAEKVPFVDPAEQYQVPTLESEEEAEFKAWKRARDERRAAAANPQPAVQYTSEELTEQTIASVDQTPVEEDLTSPPQITVNESASVASNAFESQGLRRDHREQS